MFVINPDMVRVEVLLVVVQRARDTDVERLLKIPLTDVLYLKNEFVFEFCEDGIAWRTANELLSVKLPVFDFLNS